MLVEGTDVPRGMSYRQAARKAVAMCVSDFASKGVSPDSFMVSLGLRRGVTQAQVQELGLGFKDAEHEWGVRLVGGDTNEARELVIDCAMVGFSRSYVSRSGARVGDILAVTGKFGHPPAGLLILEGKARADGEFGRRARDSVLTPSPNLAVGIALRRYFTSAMDSSDGLARSLHTLADASGVGFAVDRLPTGEGVERFARSNDVDGERLVLNGGEEYLIVGTVAKAKFRAAVRAAERCGGVLLPIGVTTSKRGKVEFDSGSGSREIPDEGWTHLG